MKASIPDTGTVIRLEGENAVISMQGDASCRKCGAAAIGLCKGGMLQVLTVRNSTRARVGDRVKIRLVQEVQFKGYLLAYVIPASAFILGIVGGHFLGSRLGFPPLDIIAGFFLLVVAAFFSFRRLKRLDNTNSIEIVNVLLDPWVPEAGEQCRGTGVNL
jgi:positive regulator of sigma E activity